MEPFRLDRGAFKIQSQREAAQQRAYWMSKSPKERLAAAWYLICSAYGLDYAQPQPMDRSAFSIRNRPRSI